MELNAAKYWLPVWFVLVVAQSQNSRSGFFDYTDFSGDLQKYLDTNENPILHQSNKGCTATVAGQELQGICKLSMECGWDRDSIRGRTNACGLLSTCCIYSYTCGGISSAKVSYFRNDPSLTTTTPRSCEHRVQLQSRNICQIRLDFVRMKLALPLTENGACSDESFSVPDHPNIPIICGENSGQHMYIPVNGMQTIQVTLRVQYRTATADWMIRVTQLYCPGTNMSSIMNLRNQLCEINYQKNLNELLARDFPLLAPSNCLQYYRDTSGEFSSFGYHLDETQSRYSRPLDYSICFRRNPSSCVRFTPQRFATEANDFLFVPRFSSTSTSLTVTDGQVSGTVTPADIFFSRADYVDFVVPPPTTATTPLPVTTGFRISYDSSGISC